MEKIISIFLVVMVLTSLQVNAQPSIPASENTTADTPPTIPVGLDGFRMWEQWPAQRIGARAYMTSTYDREGGNRSADCCNFLWFGQQEDFNVPLDLAGPGVLYFVRTNVWHGSPWHYVVDGTDNLVRESGTPSPETAKDWDPRENLASAPESITFIPSEPFPDPLAYTWGTTKGADLMGVPMGFQESLQLAYSRTFYGTGYYIYKKYANPEHLSQPIRTWSLDERPGQDVLDLINRAGTDIAPKDIARKSGTLELDTERKLVADIAAGPSVVRALKFTLPLEEAVDLERLRLQVTWDERAHPSIDAPLALFFGAGTLYNRDQKEYLVKGFPINIHYDYAAGQVELACYYPMPFFESARVELAGIEPGSEEIGYEIRYEPYEGAPHWSSYFHATYKDTPDPEWGQSILMLDTKGTEGQDEWSGSFVGINVIFSHDAFLGTLEGDPRFFYDGSQTPQLMGAGTEDWLGGGDYWGGETMTLPFVGHPVGSSGWIDTDRKGTAKNEQGLIESAYRFKLADAMPFGNRGIFTLEHGGRNLSKEHYESVIYWYGLPAASLVKTDHIDIGKAESEASHAYVSPHASEVQQIVSRYELGIDTFPDVTYGIRTEQDKAAYQKYIGAEVYPAHSQDGRYTRGTSEFTVALAPDNHGVLLRRTLDYSFPNQKARVYVADASGQDPQWDEAGIWYLAGSNTYLYSRAGGDELGKRQYNVRTSNRRFRDDEFLLPARLTRGRSAIRVRVEHLPVDQELYPGQPYPKRSAWSELKYEVYSYITPEFSLEE